MAQYTLNDQDLKIFAAKIREEEREACAKLCEDLVLGFPRSGKNTQKQCASAIRLRSVSDDSYLMLRREPAYKEGVWDQQVIK
jgi:hypothetical protein